MRRFFAILMTSLLGLSLTACGHSSNSTTRESTQSAEASSRAEKTQDTGDLKVGFLFPGDASGPDTISRTEGIEKMQYATNLPDSQVEIKTGVKLDNLEKNVDKMVSDGCNLIFSTNSAFEDQIIQEAAKNKDVEFCQEGGIKTGASKNYHTYYTKIYEGYYVAGVVAGLQMNHELDVGNMKLDKTTVGFVAQKESPENTSCFTAFELGIRRVTSQASTMVVRYVGTKGVYDDDAKATNQLVARDDIGLIGAKTSTSAPAVICAENDTLFVGNDANMIASAPKNAVTSAASNWDVYYKLAVQAMVDGKKIPQDWSGGYEDGAVTVTKLNDTYLPEDTVDEVNAVESELRKGKLKVFNTDKITVDDTPLTQLVKTNAKYKKYKAYIKNGEFQESEAKSAPAFDIMMDGISVDKEDHKTKDSEKSTAEDEKTEDSSN
ncbi:MAG: BMP family ABC transporter substrate-binding protein [Lachnospiraceae bacterium]|nr:BMP family ABC transporter substrate-binding protein [Lachnospiraceae bacterium]